VGEYEADIAGGLVVREKNRGRGVIGGEKRVALWTYGSA